MKEVFSVRVADAEASGLPVLGRYELADGRLRFVPRFAWKPGLAYRVEWRPAGLPAPSGKRPLAGTTTEFTLPLASRTAPAEVTAVYPSADRLPENQLKFYLHFSTPMSRGGSYRHVRLLDAAGEPIADPFLELGEELWDRDGRRFTLLLDPGRIKRGLVPHQEVGPVLEAGNAYTLVVLPSWKNASGEPLASGFQRRFIVAEHDATQPDIADWRLRLPKPGTRDPLVVEFGEPLDHALVERGLTVRRNGEQLEGVAKIGNQETSWQFHPKSPWRMGRYELTALAVLEDIAGNSLGRPFEVDLTRPREDQPDEEIIARPFTLK